MWKRKSRERTEIEESQLKWKRVESKRRSEKQRESDREKINKTTKAMTYKRARIKTTVKTSK